MPGSVHQATGLLKGLTDSFIRSSFCSQNEKELNLSVSDVIEFFSLCGGMSPCSSGTDVKALLSQHSLGRVWTGLNTPIGKREEGEGRAVCCPEGHVLGVK